jgi:hypothetical protein
MKIVNSYLFRQLELLSASLMVTVMEELLRKKVSLTEISIVDPMLLLIYCKKNRKSFEDLREIAREQIKELSRNHLNFIRMYAELEIYYRNFIDGFVWDHATSHEKVIPGLTDEILLKWPYAFRTLHIGDCRCSYDHYPCTYMGICLPKVIKDYARYKFIICAVLFSDIDISTYYRKPTCLTEHDQKEKDKESNDAQDIITEKVIKIKSGTKEDYMSLKMGIGIHGERIPYTINYPGSEYHENQRNIMKTLHNLARALYMIQVERNLRNLRNKKAANKRAWKNELEAVKTIHVMKMREKGEEPVELFAKMQGVMSGEKESPVEESSDPKSEYHYLEKLLDKVSAKKTEEESEDTERQIKDVKKQFKRYRKDLNDEYDEFGQDKDINKQVKLMNKELEDMTVHEILAKIKKSLSKEKAKAKENPSDESVEQVSIKKPEDDSLSIKPSDPISKT